VPSAVALIPARAGSQRVPGKNVRPLAGHPLIAYAIAGARESGLFDAVVVSTDADEIAAIARHYGAEVPFLRPAEYATSTSPDIEFVRFTLERLAEEGRSFDLFSILRPTSPFRRGTAIRRAWDQLLAVQDADSIRAVELCRQHPGKMWILEGATMRPLLDQGDGVPLHSTQYAALPQVYVQNSSLEIAWTRVALSEGGGIAGERVVAFLSDPATGFTIDYPDDWDAAERMLAAGEATLPEVRETPVAAAPPPADLYSP
jgi:CMP-N,N'-diacetyllegionaminic acid synthase